MSEITKPCVWCGRLMATQRSSKKLCSAQCHNKYHYWRAKEQLTNKGGFGVLKELLSKFRHPNKNHPSNDPSNPERLAYEIECLAWRSATAELKALTAVIEGLKQQGHIEV